MRVSILQINNFQLQSGIKFLQASFPSGVSDTLKVKDGWKNFQSGTILEVTLEIGLIKVGFCSEGAYSFVISSNIWTFSSLKFWILVTEMLRSWRCQDLTWLANVALTITKKFRKIKDRVFEEMTESSAFLKKTPLDELKIF